MASELSPEMQAAANLGYYKPMAEEKISFSLEGEGLHQFRKRALPAHKVLCGPIVAGALTIIHGASKVGKSSLMLSAAGHLAAGRSFEAWQVDKARTVLYIDQENPSGVIQSRLDLFPQTGNIMFLHRALMKEMNLRLDLGVEAHRQAIVDATLLDHPFDVVILDSLYSLNPPDDGVSANSAEWFERIMPMCDAITDRGGAVVILANLNKAGGLYGTNAQVWRVDYAWEARVLGSKKGDPMPHADAGTAAVLENTASRGMLSPDESTWEWFPRYGWRMR